MMAKAEINFQIILFIIDSMPINLDKSQYTDSVQNVMDRKLHIFLELEIITGLDYLSIYEKDGFCHLKNG